MGLVFEIPYRPFGKAILDFLPIEDEQPVVPPKDVPPTIQSGGTERI